MRLLILYSNLLYPGVPYSGAIRTVKLVEHLAGRHEVALAAFCEPEERGRLERADAMRDKLARYEIVEMPARSLPEKLRKHLGPLPAGVYHYRVEEMRARLAALARSFAPEVVHVEFTYLGEYGACFDPRETARVLVDQELQFRRYEREAAQAWGFKRKALARVQAAKCRRWEPRVAARYDRVLSITPEERDALWDLAPELPIDVYPNVVDAEEFAPRDAPERERSILFVGNYGHPPNRDALGWLLSDLFPRIRAAAPEARLRLVGAGLEAALAAVLGDAPVPEGVDAVGFAEDLVEEVARAAVFVCPVRTGGGMRGKVLEALGMERAVVTTPIGTEGIATEDGVSARIAKDAEGFAAAVVELLGDPARRRAMGRAGRRLVRSHYDVRVVFGALEALYEDLAAGKRRRARAR